MNNWIKCTDKMPNEDEMVLIALPFNDYALCDIGWLFKDIDNYKWATDRVFFNIGDMQFYSLNDITHWMPLPRVPAR